MAGSVSGNGHGTLTAAAGDVAAEVRQVFADLTRYPADVLDPSADVEEDLGIDSVKLGEILSVLRERFGLPPTTELRGRFPAAQLRTIGGITEVVVAFAGAVVPAPSSADAPVPTRGHGNGASAQAAPSPSTTDAALADEMRQIFADLTRYPLDVLAADADLEEELGIDSVKLGEIFSVLRERYALPSRAELRDRIDPKQLRTIGGIVEIVRAFGAGAEAPPAAAVAPAPQAGPVVPPAASAPVGSAPAAPAARSSVPAMPPQKFATRMRTLTWADPAVGAASVQRMEGLDYLRAVMRGEVPAPPIASVMDFDYTAVEPARVVLVVRPAEFYYEATGALHGGLAAALLGAAMDGAVRTTLPAGARFSTAELRLNVVRPLTADVAHLLCEGEVVQSSRHVASAQGRLLDEAGRLYAYATATCVVELPM